MRSICLQYILWDVLDHPQPFRTWWLVFILSLMCYVIIVTPYLIAFNIGTASGAPAGACWRSCSAACTCPIMLQDSK